MLKIYIPFQGFYESMHTDILNWESEFKGMECSYDYKEYAKIYVQQFNAWLESIGFKINLEFLELQSPRFYNFETDRILCSFPESRLDELEATSLSLEEVIKERHTSYSGFISFYSRDDFKKPISEWDSVMLETLLIAAIRDTGEELNEFDIMESALCDGRIDNCLHEEI